MCHRIWLEPLTPVVVVAITATPPIRALKTVNVDGTTREHLANQ